MTVHCLCWQLLNRLSALFVHGWLCWDLAGSGAIVAGRSVSQAQYVFALTNELERPATVLLSDFIP